jgi:hypothetical protein
VLTGGLLLAQMGTVALAGAVVITVASLLWYLVYVRERVDREGAATGAIRRQVGRAALTDLESSREADTREILVALTRGRDEDRERSLVALAADLAGRDGGKVAVSVTPKHGSVAGI